MAALDFPASPSLNDIFSSGGRSWQWDGTSWNSVTPTSLTNVTGTLAVANGGTGASDTTNARANLGLAIGTDVQAYDAGLTSIAGLTTSADQGIYTTAADTYATFSLTSAGRALLDDADAAAQRTTLGLAIGTNVQAYDAGLASIAGLTTSADQGIYTTAADTYATFSLTSAGRALLDDADAAAQRTTLGLGSIATQDASSVSITGGSITGITDLAIADGGTGASTAADARVNLLPSYTGNGSKVLSLNSGATDVEWATSSGGGGTTYMVKTANYTMANLEGVLANTSAGSFTVTLPATPSVGSQCIIADDASTFGTNNLTVGRNGSTIEGTAADLVLDINGVSVQFIYNGTTWNVFAQIGGNGGTGVNIEVSTTAPVAPFDGDLWWDSTAGRLKIYYDDGNTAQWVDASPAGSGFNPAAPGAIGGTTPAAGAFTTLSTNTLSGLSHTVQVFTTGSGTYTTPAGVKAIWVRLVGGGGGGGASATNAGTTGGNTTFSTLTGSGGVGAGAGWTAGGGGGSASGGDLNISGGGGGSGSPNGGSSGSTGGNSAFGGGAKAAQPNSSGYSAAANSGGGGSGGNNSAFTNYSGPGGGAGGYCEKLFHSPAATYSYAVGSGGAGGAAGGQAGGAGASGVIIVTEYYS